MTTPTIAALTLALAATAWASTLRRRLRRSVDEGGDGPRGEPKPGSGDGRSGSVPTEEAGSSEPVCSSCGEPLSRPAEVARSSPGRRGEASPRGERPDRSGSATGEPRREARHGPDGVPDTVRETERRFRTIFENASEAIVVVDAERETVIDFNQNARRLFGRSEDEIRSSMPFQFSPEHQPDGRRSVDAAREHLARALAGETPTVSWVLLTGYGERIHAEVRLVRLPPREGKLVQANIRDVTARKRAEEALRESEERYRSLFEQDVSGNFVTSVDGRILACNRSFAAIFGFDTVDQAVGSDTMRLCASDDQWLQLLHQIRAHGQIDFFEFRGRKLDGTLLHLVQNVQGIFDEEGRLEELRGHVVDVTEQRALEEQLQQAQRLEAVGRLAGGIAHDFNNLLTTVTGHADLLLTDDRLSPALEGDVRRIKRASERAASLTSQLVAFSRKEDLKPLVLDLNDVVAEVAEMLRRTIGEDVQLSLRTEPDLQRVRADQGQLEQVLMNLVLNARDAMPRGGSLEIVTRNVDFGKADEARPRKVDPGRYVALEVRDTGEGIAEEALDKIFDPFYTTKPPGKGSGLGLAMVYGITRQSEGHVLVESEVGEGAAFTVLLPIAGETGEAESSPPEERSGEDDRRSILLIQHDPVVRKLVRRILQREGLSVLEADDPDDAIAFCREWRGPIHGVVSDLLSADHERRLRKILAEHRPGVSILWTRESATEAPPRTDPGELSNSKPFSSQKLNRVVQELLSEDVVEEAAGGPKVEDTG